MKKILTAIVLFAFVVLPMSVMAMTSITEDELSNVTGQAGVSINVDVTANVTVGTLAWGDSDGFAQAVGTAPAGYFANPGFVGLEGMTLTVHASGRHDLWLGYGDLNYLMNDAITIDVGTNAAGTQTLVRIGLPTMHITVSRLQTDIFVSGVTAGAPTSTETQQLGSIYMDGIAILLGRPDATDLINGYNAGYVTIGAAGAGNTGVNIGFNVQIDQVLIGTISYGNTTSIIQSAFAAVPDPYEPTGAGYIGVTGLDLRNVSIVGGVGIGVATLYGSTGLPAATALGDVTQVNIIIANNTTIAIPGAITGTVWLANNQALSAATTDDPDFLRGELGNFYIGGVTAQIVDNVGSFSEHSIIQIWAH